MRNKFKIFFNFKFILCVVITGIILSLSNGYGFVNFNLRSLFENSFVRNLNDLQKFFEVFTLRGTDGILFYNFFQIDFLANYTQYFKTLLIAANVFVLVTVFIICLFLKKYFYVEDNAGNLNRAVYSNQAFVNIGNINKLQSRFLC